MWVVGRNFEASKMILIDWSSKLELIRMII